MKAIALVSGGLDSILAVKLMENQGIEVIPLNFKIPFCSTTDKINAAITDLTSKLQVVDLAEDFLEIIKKPRYGFGAHMNPCIDCRILMLRRAKALMKEYDASFIATGEVLGQRSMSQHKQALEIVEKASGLDGLVLRPLSAKLLPETKAEKEGWVNRKRLLSVNGRGRKPQIALAQEFDIKNYSQPAGGCLLTDPEFSRKLKDLIKNQELTLENIELLKLGRHFRIAENVKLVVGRNQKENALLENLARDGDYLFAPDDFTAGPTALGRGVFSDDLIRLACGITGRYCDHHGKSDLDIICRIIPEKKGRALKTLALEDAKIKDLRI